MRWWVLMFTLVCAVPVVANGRLPVDKISVNLKMLEKSLYSLNAAAATIHKEKEIVELLFQKIAHIGDISPGLEQNEAMKEIMASMIDYINTTTTKLDVDIRRDLESLELGTAVLLGRLGTLAANLERYEALSDEDRRLFERLYGEIFDIDFDVHTE